MVVAAVERKIQIISEAATRLGPEAERRCPERADRPEHYLERSHRRSAAVEGFNKSLINPPNSETRRASASGGGRGIRSTLTI